MEDEPSLVWQVAAECFSRGLLGFESCPPGGDGNVSSNDAWFLLWLIKCSIDSQFSTNQSWFWHFEKPMTTSAEDVTASSSVPIILWRIPVLPFSKMFVYCFWESLGYSWVLQFALLIIGMPSGWDGWKSWGKRSEAGDQFSNHQRLVRTWWFSRPCLESLSTGNPEYASVLTLGVAKLFCDGLENRRRYS